MHPLFGTNSVCLFAQPLLFLASVLHLKLTFSVLRSQKAPLIICAYVKVRLIEMQYIIIIIIIIISCQFIKVV
jgi:hypothetical protein